MTRYYDLETTLEKYCSPSANDFLMGIVYNSCPDAFHELDVAMARALHQKDIENGWEE